MQVDMQTFRRTDDDDDKKQHNKQAMVINFAALPAVFLSSTAGWVIVVPALTSKVWIIINRLRNAAYGCSCIAPETPYLTSHVIWTGGDLCRQQCVYRSCRVCLTCTSPCHALSCPHDGCLCDCRPCFCPSVGRDGCVSRDIAPWICCGILACLSWSVHKAMETIRV